MRILSLGAGVQSSTLALMARDGTLPGLDAAIFADTGWEPPQVYAQVNDKQENLYTTKRYPLLELGMSRKDCQRWLDKRGWGHTTKSACIGCPLHGNKAWRNLRDNHPDQWADAIDFDRRIRKGGARGLPLNGEAFLHASRVPLNQAPIDRWSRREYGELQGDLFDLLEDGDPDGCSPYGCRSGAPVEEPQ